MVKNSTILIFFFVIAAGGFLLRFWDINVTPPGIYPDEAVNGQDALHVLDGAPWQWFYSDNQGREGLFMNLVAVSFMLFGVSALSLKLPAIIFGTLSIMGTFFLTRELFRNDRIALIAMTFNAVAFTAINFSRISFRANMLPCILVWSFYFLYKGLHSKKYRDFIIAGLIFGMGMHSYIAFRIAPLILIALVPLLIFSKQYFIREYWKHIGIFVMCFIFVSAPMLYTFWMYPEYFNSRSEHVSVFSPEVNQGHPWTILTKSASLAVAKYTFVGDMNWRNNYPPYPLLDPVMGIFFLGGFGLVFYKSVQSIYRRIKQHEYSDNMVIYPFLLLWFIAMLTPEFLTYESNPHALRSIGALPMVYITAALGVGMILRRMAQMSPAGKKIVGGCVLSSLIFVIVFNPIKYFGFWANHPKTAIYFEKDITQLAHNIKEVPEDREVVVILGNMQRVPVRMFNWGRKNYTDVNPFEMDKIEPKNPENTTFYFSNFYKDDIMKNLFARYPNLQYFEIENDVGQKYYILR